MRKEIEVKARLRDPEAAVKKLEAIGCEFSKPVTQDDTVFVKSGGDFIDFKGKNFLRIRIQGGKAIFTVKSPQRNEMDRREHETEIADPAEMREAIIMLGYPYEVRIVKTRRKTHYKEYEICVDEVEGLGSYIEAEKIVDDGDALLIQEELFRFLETLGVKREDRETKGYDIIMYLKNTNEK